MVVGIDASVQLIVDKLDSLNILDSTLVIYTSDNGLVYLEHGAVIAKRVGYEESIRVPLIARYPAWFGVNFKCRLSFSRTGFFLLYFRSDQVMDGKGCYAPDFFLNGNSQHIIYRVRKNVEMNRVVKARNASRFNENKLRIAGSGTSICINHHSMIGSGLRSRVLLADSSNDGRVVSIPLITTQNVNVEHRAIGC